MPLQASGTISIADIVNEFGGTVPHSLSEYYGAAGGVPVSGMISLSDFYGKSNTPPAGQQIWTSSNTGNLALTSFVVPQGVNFISVVMVAPSGGSVLLRRSSTVLLASYTATGSGVGGGNGGASGNPTGRNYYNNDPGGGGAGGYSGDGGAGATSSTSPVPGSYTGNPGSPGNGGGGGGGGSGHGSGTVSGTGGQGGGVGLLGIGTNGSGGGGGATGSESGGSGTDGSGPTAFSYGSGSAKGSGGNLRWKNNIPVTPGETLTVLITGGSWMDYSTSIVRPLYSYGGVRMMWGKNRTYPSNAIDADAGGYKHWRVRIISTQTNAENNISLAEVQWRRTAGGAKSPPTALVSSSTRTGSSYAVSRLNDNKTTTSWQSVVGVKANVNITATLNGYLKPVELAIFTSSLVGRAPIEFAIEASDDNVNFTLLKTYSGLDMAVSTWYTFAV